MASDDELIDLIYAALLGEGSWLSFLTCLTGGIPNGSALFFAQGFGARPEFSALHYGLPEASLDAYSSHFATINPWIPGTEATAPGRGVVGHRICAQDHVRRSEYYNDFLRPLGVETSSGLVIERRPDIQFNLTILSGEDNPEATERQAAQFERLAPHLRRAARFYQSDRGLKMASELGATLLDAVDFGVLVIGTGPRLQLASNTAQLVAGRASLFRVNPIGHVRLCNADAQDCMSRMLRRLYDGPKIHRFWDDQFSLTLLHVERDGLSQLLQGPSVVVIVDPDRTRRMARRPEELSRHYGLTKAELRVLLGLLAGKSLGEIAQEAGRSQETLRSQQKALFRKLDVRSQFELVTRITYGSHGADQG